MKVIIDGKEYEDIQPEAAVDKLVEVSWRRSSINDVSISVDVASANHTKRFFDCLDAHIGGLIQTSVDDEKSPAIRGEAYREATRLSNISNRLRRSFVYRV
jgi:hypothetical protein